MSARPNFVLENKEVAAKLAGVGDTYGVAPIGKASSNLVFVCKQIKYNL